MLVRKGGMFILAAVKILPLKRADNVLFLRFGPIQFFPLTQRKLTGFFVTPPQKSHPLLSSGRQLSLNYTFPEAGTKPTFCAAPPERKAEAQITEGATGISQDVRDFLAFSLLLLTDFILVTFYFLSPV